VAAVGFVIRAVNTVPTVLEPNQSVTSNFSDTTCFNWFTLANYFFNHSKGKKIKKAYNLIYNLDFIYELFLCLSYVILYINHVFFYCA
jgi:hypothetical protein